MCGQTSEIEHAINPITATRAKFPDPITDMSCERLPEGSPSLFEQAYEDEHFCPGLRIERLDPLFDRLRPGSSGQGPYQPGHVTP
jgi:hypothetical protein